MKKNMKINMNVKRLSVVGIVIAAAILMYGFIDAQGYRAGYMSGYSMMTRVLDVACMKGDVLDAELCAKTELALYGEGSDGDGIYAAQAVDAILGTGTTRTSRWRSRRTSVQAAVPVAAPEPVVQPAPVVVEAPRPQTAVQIAQAVNCSSAVNQADCSKGLFGDLCKWGIYNAYGVASSAAKCNETMGKISLGGDTDPESICSKQSVKDQLTAAYKYVGTDPSTGQQIEVCIGINGRFGFTTKYGILDVLSWSEGMRTPAVKDKFRSLGATAAVIQQSASSSLPPCPMMQPGGPIPTMPPGGCTPPAGMGGGQPPPGGQPPH